MANKAKHFWIEPDALSQKGFDYISERAQWLWFRVMLLLHNSERYGHFTRDGKSVTDEQAARRLRLDVQEWIALRDELLDFGLLKETGDGILYSPELVAQAEWRAKEAKRQKDFQKKKKAESNTSNNGSTNEPNNGYITDIITDNSQGNFKPKKPSSFSNEKKEGGGTRTRAESPPTAAKSPDSKKDTRQWMELTETEKQMSLEEFLVHLQIRFEKKNVRAIAKKLKDFCDKNGVDFQFERLKGWVYGEGKTITEEEFLAAIGDEETKSARQLAIENCSKCDNEGRIKVEGKFKECNHK